MKQLFTIVFAALTLTNANAQLIVNDNFSNYNVGSINGKGSPAWLPFTLVGGEPQIQVEAANELLYPGYQAGGNYVTLVNRTSGLGRSSFKAFTKNIIVNNTVGSPTQTVYYSFLVRVSEAFTTQSNGNYCVSLRRADGQTENESVGRFSINKDAGNNWIFGVAAGNGFSYYNTNSTSTSEVFLVLMRFDLVPGSNNDVAYMWVNPSLASEPATAAANATSTGNNLDFGTQLDALMLFQRDVTNRPVAQFDGFKVAVGTTSAAAFSSLGTTQTMPSILNDDNFTGFTPGNLSPQGSWIAFSSGDVPQVEVLNTTPLNYSSYPAGAEYIGIKNRTAGLGRSHYKNFAYPVFNHNIATGSTQTIYYSFLVRMSEAFTAQENGNYSVALRRAAGTTENESVGRFTITKETGTNKWQFRLASATTQTAPYTTNSTSTSEVFLILMRYDVVPNGNDAAYLWVNPLTGTEPTTATANLTSTGTDNSYGDRLDALMVFQRDVASRPAAFFDGFRVATGATSAQAFSNLALPPGGTLPVTLQRFTAASTATGNKLNWLVASQVNVSRYEIEGSADGRNFNLLGTMNATNSTTYDFTDRAAAAAKTFYRLKMIDRDGSFTYSAIVFAGGTGLQVIKTYPNPVSDMVAIQHPAVAGEGSIRILNVKGQVMSDIKIVNGAVSTSVNVSQLGAGRYTVIFKNGGTNLSAAIIKE